MFRFSHSGSMDSILNLKTMIIQFWANLILLGTVLHFCFWMNIFYIRGQSTIFVIQFLAFFQHFCIVFPIFQKKNYCLIRKIYYKTFFIKVQTEICFMQFWIPFFYPKKNVYWYKKISSLHLETNKMHLYFSYCMYNLHLRLSY